MTEIYITNENGLRTGIDVALEGGVINFQVQNDDMCLEGTLTLQEAEVFYRLLKEELGQ